MTLLRAKVIHSLPTERIWAIFDFTLKPISPTRLSEYLVWILGVQVVGLVQLSTLPALIVKSG